MEDFAKKGHGKKDFAKIERGADGRQVVVYIEYMEKDDCHALVVMAAYPTSMSNAYALEHGTLDEMEILLDAFDEDQATSILHCFDMYVKRAGVLDACKDKVRPFRH